MEELQLALTSARVDQRNFGLWIKNWQVGQTLSALVTTQRPTGEMVLRVAGQQITATADIPIQQGARLLLEVKQLEPVPTLRVLNPVTNLPVPVAAGAVQLLAPNGAVLASPALAAVTQNLQSAQVATSLPPVLADTLNQVLRQTLRPERLAQPGVFAKAVRDSGVFLEAEMSASLQGRQTNPADDLKAGLFRALARVEAALAKIDSLTMNAADASVLLDVKKELEAGLGRITLQQLNSQPVEGNSVRSWQFDLPVQLGADFHSLLITLEHEPASEEAVAELEDDAWNVKLRLAPQAMGAVEVSLRLQGDDLSLRVAAQRDEVRALIDAAMPTLDKTLRSHGLHLASTSAANLEASSAAATEDSVADRLSIRA